MGRLTRDPELRHTQNGVAVASFTVAVARAYKSDGEKREVDFIDCVAWRNTAEYVSKYFCKGKLAVVEGRIQIRTYEDKQENKRKAFEIIAENVFFGDSKKDADGASAQSSYPAYQEPESQYAPLDIDDGDLPF